MLTLKSILRFETGHVGVLQSRYVSFTLSESQKILKKRCREFAEAELVPRAAYTDEHRAFPREQLKKLGDLGLMSAIVSKKYGGKELDYLSYVVALEELARGCYSSSGILAIHNSLFLSIIQKYGTEDLKEKYIVPFTKGDNVGCFALTEPENGSDAGSTETVATEVGSGYSINGVKSWITNAHEAEACIFFATTNTSLKHKGINCYVTSIPAEGLKLGAKKRKMGGNGTSTSKIIFNNCFVSKENLLGKPGFGFKIAMEALDAGRISSAAQSVGIAQAAFDCAIDYSTKRLAFGAPIMKLQTIQNKLSDMALQIECARLLTYKAAVAKQENKPFSKESAMAKLYASEAAVAVCHQAMQTLGGIGYSADMPAERHYRDARLLEIVEGTSEIQRLVIAGHLVKEHKTVQHLAQTTQ